MDTDKAESSTGAESTTTEQIIDQMGGASGLVLSTVPAIALVVAHLFLPLMPTLAVALGAGAVLFVMRLARGEKVPSAIGSLLGVAVAAALVIWTGSVRDFFVIGIWAALAIFLPTAISVVARRPLTGMIWNAVHGGEHAWREDRPTYRPSREVRRAAVAVRRGEHHRSGHRGHPHGSSTDHFARPRRGVGVPPQHHADASRRGTSCGDRHG